MKKWLFSTVSIMVGIIVIFLLNACTGNVSSTAPSPSPGTSTAASQSNTAKPATTTTASPQNQTPVRGGILKFATSRPALAFGYPPQISGPDNFYARPFLERLIRQDSKGAYQPELATSWEIAKDGKSITFKLRQGVKFNDGTDLNAQAVKFNFDQLIPPTAQTLAGVTSIDVVDDSTVKINLSAFNNLILYQMALDMKCCIISPTAFQKNGKEWALTHPVGTGPYILKDFQPNTSISYTPNPNYWNKGLPYLDGIVATAIVDPMTQMLVLKTGEVNFIYDGAATISTQLRDAGFQLLTTPAALQSLSMDTLNSDSIFANQKVREAMEYAIDKESICKDLGSNLYKPMYQFVDSNSPYYNPSVTIRKYDPVKAKQLLSEAGFPNGFTFKYFSTTADWKEGYVAVQSYLSAIGIKMDINYIDAAVYQGNIKGKGQLEKSAGATSVFEIRGEPLFLADSYLTTKSQFYRYMVIPSAMDDLVAKAKAAQDDSTKTQLMQQATKLIYESQPFITLWAQPRILITDKRTHDLGFFIFGDTMNSMPGYSAWLSN